MSTFEVRFNSWPPRKSGDPEEVLVHTMGKLLNKFRCEAGVGRKAVKKAETGFLAQDLEVRLVGHNIKKASPKIAVLV